MSSVTLEITNCMDCPNHEVQGDPDPDDWFCDDDVKVICKIAPKGRNGLPKNITVACRPYQTRQECDVPDWCPLKEKTNAP